ncbi:Serum response factor-binding protein 1 [Carex littledalei]|uniref:Serum response factor-binding protein 1 n=1 Tax=Carex littledalei TaxID=544730 RepID=A0A833V2T4_9POAL|nr:Serum response factor-binding protein 1 [Carex littledalei]
MHVLYFTDYMDKDGDARKYEFVQRRKSPRLNPSCSANVSLPQMPPPKEKPTKKYIGPVVTRSGAKFWFGPKPVISQPLVQPPSIEKPAAKLPSADQPGSSRSPPRVVGSADMSQTKAAAPEISQPLVQPPSIEKPAAKLPSADQPGSSRSPPRVVGSADMSQTKAAAPEISQPLVQPPSIEKPAAKLPSADQPGSSRSPPRVVGSADMSQTKAAAPEISQPLVQPPSIEKPAAKLPSADQPGSSRSPPRVVGSADMSQTKAAAPEISQPPVQTPSIEESAAQSPSADQPGSAWSPPRVVEHADLSQTMAGAPDLTRDSSWPSWDRTYQSPNMENWEGADLSRSMACSDQSSEPSDEQCQNGQSRALHFYVGVDDGSRRCQMRRPLRECPEALAACGQELVASASEGPAAQKKRKRNKEKSDVRCWRGLAKPRDPTAPADRPELLVVGDGEFTCSPICTKVITTIRLLTLENLPGPFRSYKMFPTKARLAILIQFMQRYSWGPEEDIKRCLDVFENIAAEAYQREMTETRAMFKKKYEADKEVWKIHPPKWCKNVEAWKGLCDIWSTPKWDQISTINRDNRTKSRGVVYHVAGSRSTYKHKQALISEKGQSVGLLDVFDRTHTRQSEEGKVYVNKRARDTADEGSYQSVGDSGSFIWSTTKSTATSADSQPRKYTKDEVSGLLAAERKEFASSLAAQEKRHKSEMDDIAKHNEYIIKCFGQLFNAQGLKPPEFNGSGSAGTAGGGHNEGEETAQPSTTNS